MIFWPLMEIEPTSDDFMSLERRVRSDIRLGHG